MIKVYEIVTQEVLNEIEMNPHYKREAGFERIAMGA
jgi:hypothetical protein